ncbi:MAG: hypothetical protein M0003_13265 [Acidithiobacillus sp.]|nr:hypothetical protein [Acidithiobacillus sp.]
MNTLDHLWKFLVEPVWYPAYAILFMLAMIALIAHFGLPCFGDDDDCCDGDNR